MNSIYPTMARNNIRKNYRFFIPRILTESGLLGCLFILRTLFADKQVAAIRGGEYIQTCMAFGVLVLVLLSVILMLYTNSFLMKQRKREFGLYNVLGMEKRHISRVLFHESMICSISSLLLGSAFGILFYKLASLLICKLLASTFVPGFYFITWLNILLPVIVFAALDVTIYLINRISISRMNPVELLQSTHSGEKEPRVKWVFLVVGLLSMAAGYYISLTTESPLEALLMFFLAVLLVILGTYLLFVSGSVFVLKRLKHNQRYYYTKRHMPAVSGLLYRMKQNAVGLASIAILACGVLVMISTTISLYSGMEDTLSKNYPQHLYFAADYENTEHKQILIPDDALEDMTRSAAKATGLEIQSIERQHYVELAFLQNDPNTLIAEPDHATLTQMADIVEFTILTADAYRDFSGQSLDLQDNEVALCTVSLLSSSKNLSNENLLLGDMPLRVKKTLPIFPVKSRMVLSGVNCYGLVVANDETLQQLLSQFSESTQRDSVINRLAVTFQNIDKASAMGSVINDSLSDSVEAYYMAQPDRSGGYSVRLDSIWDSRDDYFGLNGTLLFLGIILGLVFLFATTLIIYYKQISEGYEDRQRFQIMQKIGMSSDEVRKTIRSQILLVFFLPLLVAGIHVAVAFPILEKLLHVLLLSSTWLFVKCTVVVFLIFALVYWMIYSFTAKTYYKIVH